MMMKRHSSPPPPSTPASDDARVVITRNPEGGGYTVDVRGMNLVELHNALEIIYLSIKTGRVPWSEGASTMKLVTDERKDEDMALTEMPRDGQRVRVVLEGDAWGVSGETFRVGERGWNIILPTASHVTSVEVLRPPVGVGDVLAATADLAMLPLRAVVLDRAGDAWQRHADDWRCTTGGICTTSDTMITGYGPFTVVSLGRGAT